MLLSKAVPLLRQAISRHAGMKARAQVTIPIRNGGGAAWVYRSQPDPIPRWDKAADYMGALMWWWIFYNVFTSYDHLIGEFPYPDASQWTDEELGVPPDDYDPNSN